MASGALRTGNVRGQNGADEHALRAWLWEQRVACMTHGHGGLGYGTLGYGGNGLDLGFYGFGLSFHLGYGYGGKGTGRRGLRR